MKFKTCTEIFDTLHTELMMNLPTWFLPWCIHLIHIRSKVKCSIKRIFMIRGFLIVDLWNRLYGLLQKKMLKVNTVNVILAHQTLVKRNYIVILLERSRKGLLEYYYLVYFLKMTSGGIFWCTFATRSFVIIVSNKSGNIIQDRLPTFWGNSGFYKNDVHNDSKMIRIAKTNGIEQQI